MRNAEFVDKVGVILKNKGIEAKKTEEIKAEITSLITEFKISPDLRKGPRKKGNPKSYRVRYKIFDEEKGFWDQFEAIREGHKAGDAKEAVMKEFPNCRITSAWMI